MPGRKDLEQAARLPIIYIAGKFRAPSPWEVELNIRRAEECGMVIAELGAIPLIPHTMYRFWDGTLPDSFWLACGLQLLGKCDGIVIQGDYTGSTGTRGEFKYAAKKGIAIAVVEGYEGSDLVQLSHFVAALKLKMRGG